MYMFIYDVLYMFNLTIDLVRQTFLFSHPPLFCASIRVMLCACGLDTLFQILYFPCCWCLNLTASH